MKLNGKKAIITGGTRGIGFAVAQTFLNEGAEVLITGRNEETLADAVEKLGGVHVSTLVWDVAQIEDAQEKVREAASILGGLDVLVNNAGVLTREDFGGMLAVTPESFDRTINTNLRGLFFLCQAAAKYWIEERRGGRIVNVCSNNAFRALDTAYAASKWAVRGLTQGMGKRLAPMNIFVNAVAPGPTATTMLGVPDGETHTYNGAPIGRYSYPSEIASVCAFLGSEEAGSIVGQVLLSDGGETLL